MQEQRALDEHERLRKAMERDPKDSELRAAVDKAYDTLSEIRRKIVLLGESEESK